MKPVPGFAGYWASKDGRVFSGFQQVSPGGHANGFRTVISDKPMKELRQTVDQGYKFVGLYRAGVKMRKVPVHAVLLETFIGPRQPLQHVARHLNGDPFDNAISNLCWGTVQQNIDDRERIGRTARGERQGNSKLTANEVREIRSTNWEKSRGGKRIKRGVVRAACDKYGISRNHFWRVLNNGAWSHVA